jgi:hypothetical protein
MIFARRKARLLYQMSNLINSQSLCEKYHEKTLQGAKELTKFRGDFFLPGLFLKFHAKPPRRKEI